MLTPQQMIADIRKHSDLDGKGIGEAIGVNQSTISRIENGSGTSYAIGKDIELLHQQVCTTDHSSQTASN